MQFIDILEYFYYTRISPEPIPFENDEVKAWNLTINIRNRKK
jgi:hypothetical protein